MLLRFSPKVDHIKVVYLVPEAGTKITRNSVLLTPGVNEVTDDEYKCMVRSIMAELDSKEIYPMVTRVANKGAGFGKPVKNLVELPVKLAVSYVNECMNADTLKKWYKEEVREEVRVQIVNKMDELGIDKPIQEIPDVEERNLVSNDEVNDIIGITNKTEKEEVVETVEEVAEPEEVVEEEAPIEVKPRRGRRS